MSGEEHSTYLKLGSDENPCFLYENGSVKVIHPVGLGARIALSGLTIYGVTTGFNHLHNYRPRVYKGILCSVASIAYLGLKINDMYLHQFIMKKIGF